MDEKQVELYLTGKPGANLDFPFGHEVKVFKVRNKMFATLSYNNDRKLFWMNLKCDPDEAIALRDIFQSVIPGYHMNKRHWNTICLDDSIPKGEIERMMDNSYELVVKSLSKKQRQGLLSST